MTIYNKPDTQIFAKEAKQGEITSFPDLERGWGVTIATTNGIPPMEYFNAIQNRTDQAIAYLMQRGVAEWREDLEYPKFAITILNGQVFFAKEQNIAKNPLSNPETWVNSFAEKANLSDVYTRDETTRSVDTIEDLKKIDLKENDIVELLGYYSKNDGAIHKRVISGEQDDTSVTLANGLYANLVENSYINVKWLGAKGDGKNDDTAIIQGAINNKKTLPVYIPAGTYCISDTLILGYRWRRLIGEQGSRIGVSTIKWIGDVNDKKAMLIMGGNQVGDKPDIDCSGNILKYINFDGNKKVGILVYATYLTNETIIEGVSGENSLEYNFYFAKGWYATIKDITSNNCRNNGIALGMPLEFSDGTKYDWGTPNLELNNMLVSNIRSARAGERFKSENYDPKTPSLRRHGYGIGAGEGNGFRLENFLSEASGGAGLYVYTSFQPSKLISKGYLEGNMLNSTAEKGNIVLESASYSSGYVHIRDIFNNIDSGAIYRFLSDGLAKSTIQYKLTNIEMGTKFLDFNSRNELVQYPHTARYVTFENSWYTFLDSGTNNPMNQGCELSSSVVTKVNVRYSWEATAGMSGCTDVLVKRLDNNYSGKGTYYAYDSEDKEISSYLMPDLSELPLNVWARIKTFKDVAKLKSANPQGGLDTNLLIKFVKAKSTH